MFTALQALINDLGTLLTNLGGGLTVDNSNATGGAVPDGASDVISGLLGPIGAASGGLGTILIDLGGVLTAL